MDIYQEFQSIGHETDTMRREIGVVFEQRLVGCSH